MNSKKKKKKKVDVLYLPAVGHHGRSGTGAGANRPIANCLEASLVKLHHG